MSGRRLRESEAIKEASAQGRGFEAAIDAEIVPPPGYLWVNKFLSGDSTEWLPGLPHAASTLPDRLDTEAWLTRLANSVKAREPKFGTAAEVNLLWTSFTTGLAGITLSATYEFLDEQTDLAARVDELIASDPGRAGKAWLPDTEPRVSVLAEAVRQGLHAKEVVFGRGRYVGSQGTQFEWDAKLPSKTLGVFWMLLEQECNNYLRMPAYGLFDPNPAAPPA